MKLKVTMSVPGRFHAFYLAKYLEKNVHLERLVTSYPKFEVEKHGISRKKIKSIFIKEVLSQIFQKILFFHSFSFLISGVYDYFASKKIVAGDIFIGWSEFSLRSIRKAKIMGLKTIVDCGSSHVVFQNNIISEEYKLCRSSVKISHPKIIEKALSEYNEADYIMVPSTFARNSFVNMGIPEEKLIQVPYGVDLEEFRQIPKTEDIFRIIFVGGMCLRKGVHYLLQAFSELNLPNSELLLVGSMNREMKTFFEKYKGKFRWVGHIPQKDLHKYYSQSSVFVLNSIEDGFGMVIPQAMACGLPVICTTNTGGLDVVREGKDGFIISIRDVEKLKERLIYLYSNQDICRQMGQSAKERVKEFTWTDYGDRIVNEYKKILNKHD